MVIFRKVLFYLFFALYLVLCPVIIFYALGYIFTPKLEEGLTKTGLIHIDTLPSNALISIGKRHYAEKTPATLRNLLPGSYDIHIQLPGHRPWAQKVTVAAGKAVNLEKILLIPKTIKTQSLASGPFEDLLNVPGTRYMFLQSGKRAGDLKVFDWKSGELRAVIASASSWADARLGRILTAKESSFVLLQVDVSGRAVFLGIDLDKERSIPKDLSALFPKGGGQEVLWEGARPDYLFNLKDQELSRLDLEKMNVLPDLLSGIRGFGLFRNKIYALQGDSIVRTSASSRKGEEVLVEKGIFLENLFGNTGKYKIDFISNSTICFWGDRGQLFSNVLPYHFVNDGVRGYEADVDGRRILLWQSQRVGVLDFEKPERKKEFFERGPEIDWVFANGRDIRQAYFVHDAAYILFCDRNKVYLSRVGAYGVPPEEIAAVREGSDIIYMEKTGKLYYLEPSQGSFVSAGILPEGISFSGVMSELEKETQGALK
jgi:PEGA domain